MTVRVARYDVVMPNADARPPLWIKVCGLVDVDNAVAVAAAGVDAIGLNFYPKSRRVVDVPAAAAIVDAAAEAVGSRCQPVGLFVNASADQIAETCGRTGIRVVQLHGDESDADLAAVSKLGEVDRVIRALRVRQIADLEWGPSRPPVDRLLLDALSDSGYGGTGMRLDWTQLPQARSRAAVASVILAGGLTPSNVADAVRLAQPDGVDTASGVEDRPGWKAIDAVRSFVSAARDAHRLLAASGSSA